MATIKAIERQSVHQIQSGQVIVDLCSVVKELVENSLDAGATSIDVRFKNHGLDVVEVQDNGQGISPENYQTVALKHFTSKLSSYAELASLRTFGFRGEALSSLCAVSDLYLITAQATEAPKGCKLEFERVGKLKAATVTASPKGTTVVVENLFHTLPVRRKEFEKNFKREYVKVLGVLQAYACISTGTKVTVSNQNSKGKRVTVFATKANSNTKENIANVFGSKTLSSLMPLDLAWELQPATAAGQQRSNAERQDAQRVQVRGHISRPAFGETRQAPDRQMFFVNGRPCGLSQVARVFNEVYKSYSVAQSPFIFADLQMDTNSYDVNVSPDKRTIFLHDQSALLEALRTSITELLESQDLTLPYSAAQQPAFKQLSLRRQLTNASESSIVDDNGMYDGDDGRSSINNPTQSSELDSKRDPSERFRQMNSSLSDEPDETAISERIISDVPDGARNTEPTQDSRRTAHSGTPCSGEELRRGTQVKSSSQAQREHRNFEKPTLQEETTSQEMISSPQPPQAEGEGRLPHHSDIMESIPSVSMTRLRPAPSALQAAVDGARPRRKVADTATITIGSKTVTTSMNSSSFKPPRWEASLGEDVTRSRNNITTKIRAFSAANGRAYTAAESGVREDELATDSEGSHRNYEGSPDDERVSFKAASDYESALVEGDDGEIMTTMKHATTSNHEDTEFLDEVDKKSKEEAKVAQLIHEAEQKTHQPLGNGTDRVRALGRVTKSTSTVQLQQCIETSVAAIEKHLASSNQWLRHFSILQIPAVEDEPEEIESSSVAERLSLTVSKQDFCQMRVVGQFNLGFILAVRSPSSHSKKRQQAKDAKEELFIIDQHASDEIYNFERLQAQTNVQSQPLVTPRTLELTAIEEETICENRQALDKNGFIVKMDETGVAPVGRRCKLLSLPMSRELVFDVRDLEELLALLVEIPPGSAGASISRPSKIRRMFAMRACRSSIMIGHTLTMKQMITVIRHMGDIDKPWNCPHGRPTMRHLRSLDSWAKWEEGDGFQEPLSTKRRQHSEQETWKTFMKDQL